MNRFTVAAAVAASCLVTTAFANADSTPGEIAFTTNMQQATPAKSREQVRAELDAARKDPRWNLWWIGLPAPAARNATALTRADVENELARARKLPSWSARNADASPQ